MHEVFGFDQIELTRKIHFVNWTQTLFLLKICSLVSHLINDTLTGYMTFGILIFWSRWVQPIITNVKSMSRIESIRLSCNSPERELLDNLKFLRFLRSSSSSIISSSEILPSSTLSDSIEKSNKLLINGYCNILNFLFHQNFLKQAIKIVVGSW